MLDVDSILKEKGLNRADLAKLLGKGDNRSYVTNVLNGNPNLKTLQEIALALDVEVRDLFSVDKKGVTPIYIKDEHGKEIEIGFLKKENPL